MKFVLCGFLFLSASFIHAQSDSVSQKQVIDNLTAFTKLYGYVRFFHPSDEAAAADWNKLALYGVGKVKNAKNAGELKQSLNEIFLPLAPTMQLLIKIEKPAPLMKYDNTANLKTVAWQHFGVQTNNSDIYRSVRFNRDELKPVSGNGAYQEISEQRPYQNKYFRLTAHLKADIQAPNYCGFSFDTYGPRMNMKHTLKTSTDGQWKPLVLAGRFPKSPRYSVFCVELIGGGCVWVDDIRFEISDDSLKWTSVNILNPGFEAVNEMQLPSDWNVGGKDYIYSIDKNTKLEGQASLRIESKPGFIPGMLFPEFPRYGEVISKPLNEDLSVHLPLALYADSNGTFPRSDTNQFDSFIKKINDLSIDSFGTKDTDTKLAAVVVSWNAIQHFYPYFDVIKINWYSDLSSAFSEIISHPGISVKKVLLKMLASIQDGHAYVFERKKNNDPVMTIPILVDRIENKLVITSTGDSTKYLPGDIIDEFNGEKADDFYKRQTSHISGTEQYKNAALKNSIYDLDDYPDTIPLIIIREGKKIKINAVRNYPWFISESRDAAFKKINDSLMYVDLSRTNKSELDSNTDDLVKAKGIIFDMRGYHNNFEIIFHLTDSILKGPDMMVPHILYPDREGTINWTTDNTPLSVQAPKFKGKIVFLISGSSISQIETYLSYVERYRLGELVGETTAGCNGNVNDLWLPGGYNVSWTGMKVLKQDGSQHHLIGIKPTYPVKRTIKAIREGRDEYLEKAIEILTKKK